MEPQPYIPGYRPADSGPLARFLPLLEEGVLSARLARLGQPGAWLIDPFGFSPRLVLEAARCGHRVLVTANNPVTRFLLDMAADPPSPAEFTAALADLGAVKKGEERLGRHLRSLYETTCDQCGQSVQADHFIWRRGADAPHARSYECPVCGRAGEHPATEEDAKRARSIAATDALHRSRAFEKVAALYDEDRVHAEQAIQHYLPRPLYALTTIISRLDSMQLPPERRRALIGLVLLACDAGSTLWPHPAERPRPKQLLIPAQFREFNIWLQLERAAAQWTATGSPVRVVTWPNKVPEEGGICVYEGRLKDLAEVVRREIPVKAVFGSIPRPNQAFWTLSALWAGWLWGRAAVEPYKVTLRRRRYDWAWNTSALASVCGHLHEILPDGVPFFGLLPEPEPSFLSSAFIAAHSAGWTLVSAALRSEQDPVQVEWVNDKNKKPSAANGLLLPNSIHEHLVQRGEPAPYLHLHAAGLCALAETGALHSEGQEFDDALRRSSALIEAVLKDGRFVHYSTGEAPETGLWGLREERVRGDSLSDKVEMSIVDLLQKRRSLIYLEIESELNAKFPGLLTPSKQMIYAVLNSYAQRQAGAWVLRSEDLASARRADLEQVTELLGTVGKRLGYAVRRQGRTVEWEGGPSFWVTASALLNRALEGSPAGAWLVLPGGRAPLLVFKRDSDPLLAARMKDRPILKFRLLRAMAEETLLTRDSFEEQAAGDPVEFESAGQMMMF